MASTESTSLALAVSLVLVLFASISPCAPQATVPAPPLSFPPAPPLSFPPAPPLSFPPVPPLSFPPVPPLSFPPVPPLSFPPVPPLSFVNVTFVNNLTQTLSVTIGAPPSGTPQSTTIAPGANGTLPVDVLAPLLVQDILQFRGNGTLYIDTASGQAGALGRLLALLGVLSIVVVDGPCSTGQAGLTLMDYAAGTLINPMGCAVRQ